VFDILITATKRPDVLAKTLDSFKKNLFKDAPVTVFLNVDPVGSTCDPRVLLEVVLDYFPNVVWRNPAIPDFAKAFKWCWMQSSADWVFHLEDDWELLRPVDMGKLISILEKNKDLALLRLPFFYSGEDRMKNWNKFFPWNGEFYECPKEMRQGVGFCGHPSLIKGEFVHSIAPHLSEESNPEKQFHHINTKVINEVLKWRYGVYGVPISPPFLKDLGRKWMVQNNLKKKGSKAFFTTWEEV